MPELGKYATEVLAAYGVTIVLLGGLIAITWHRARRIREALDRAEAGRKDH